MLMGIVYKYRNYRYKETTLRKYMYLQVRGTLLHCKCQYMALYMAIYGTVYGNIWHCTWQYMTLNMAIYDTLC